MTRRGAIALMMAMAVFVVSVKAIPDEEYISDAATAAEEEDVTPVENFGGFGLNITALLEELVRDSGTDKTSPEAAADRRPDPHAVNIKGIDKRRLLRRLWEAQIAGHEELRTAGRLTNVTEYTDKGVRFNETIEYHLGRPIWTDLSGDTADPRPYDKSAGPERFVRVVRAIRLGVDDRPLTEKQRESRLVRTQARMRYVFLMTVAMECGWMIAEGAPMKPEKCIYEQTRRHALMMAYRAEQISGDHSYALQVGQAHMESATACHDQYSDSCKAATQKLLKLFAATSARVPSM